ncbi:hypothetical protein H6F96_08660 [Microcoleus sp. FACHB-53]|nr:hypothetical protein [Microcoleus sp. FACHB-53]
MSERSHGCPVVLHKRPDTVGECKTVTLRQQYRRLLTPPLLESMPVLLRDTSPSELYMRLSPHTAPS